MRIASGPLAVGLFLALVAQAVPLGASESGPAAPIQYLVGYLTWNNGKGGISWDAPGPSEDPGGPPISNDAVQGWEAYAEQWTAGYVGHVFFGPVIHEEFVSDALPRTVYVNPNAKIRLDLILKPGPRFSTGPGVELTFGDAFLAGQTAMASGYTYGCTNFYNPSPPVPDGYRATGYCMHPEIGKISAGKTLTIKVNHTRERNPGDFQYGLGPGHASVIRIPIWGPDDVIHRIPEFAEPAAGGGQAPSAPTTQSGPSSRSTGPLAGAGGIALVGLVGLAVPRRRRPTLVALVGLFVLLAGCSTSSHTRDSQDNPEALGGHAQSTLIPDPSNATGFGGKGGGAVAGAVSDDQGTAIDAARVSLLGTDFYGKTDRGGHFNFTRVPTGTYVLRVEKADFKPLEERVDVRDKNVTRVDVQLELLSGATGDFRPHRHPGWGDEPSIPLQAVDVPMTTGGGYSSFNGRWNLAQGDRILPGTDEIEVKVSWPPSVGIGKLGLSIWGGLRIDPYNGSSFYPRASGTSFHVRTAWESNDPGHQQFTSWPGFGLYLPDDGQDGNEETNAAFLAATYANGWQVHVEMTIHKGVVPLEDAHRDFWGANTTLLVMEQGTSQVLRVPGYTYVKEERNLASFGYGDAYAGWQPTRLVPPGTTWLDVKMRQNRPLTSGSTDWIFMYKGAETLGKDGYSYYGCYSETFADAGHPTPAYQKSQDGLGFFFRVPIDPKDPDPFYAKVSNWCFWAMAPNSQDLMVDYLANQYQGTNPVATPLKLFMTVTAHNDPIPA